MDLWGTAQKVWGDFTGLQRAVDQEKQKLLDLTRRFDLLSQKLSTPGTKFLVDLEYRMVYNGTLVVPRGYVDATTFAMAPGLVDSPIIETLPGSLHAVYAVSAYCATADSPVICDGASWSATNTGTGAMPYDALLVSLVRTYATAPTRVDVTVQVLSPFYTATRTVAVKVWRRLGIG